MPLNRALCDGAAPAEYFLRSFGSYSSKAAKLCEVDEFFGNLYHLNAEEEPEDPDYPKNPEFKKHFGPRGVIHSYADGKIEDTGPLTIKRIETLAEGY